MDLSIVYTEELSSIYSRVLSFVNYYRGGLYEMLSQWVAYRPLSVSTNLLSLNIQCY